MLWIAHLQIIKVHKPQLSPKFKPDKIGTLNGDFSPLQAKRFFERYDLLIHQPNTDSGFSATLFGEKSYNALYNYIT